MEEKKNADQQIQFVQLKKEKTILWVIQPLTASEEDHDIKRRNHTRKQTIRIDKIGFTTAEPFDSLKESLEEQKQLAILLALNIQISMSVFIQK